MRDGPGGNRKERVKEINSTMRRLQKQVRVDTRGMMIRGDLYDVEDVSYGQGGVEVAIDP